MKKSLWTGLVVAALMLVNASVFAADTKKVVLQVSDGNVATFNQALNVATNLQKAYGLPNVDVEIVAFGYGLKMLVPNAKDKEITKIQSRIDGLAQNQVRFSACETTMKGMAKKTGKMPVLNKNAVVVSGGILRLVELSEKGYVIVRP